MTETQNHRDLLHATEVLYVRWCANRVEPFNVFSVLRSANDEVNLHSRFLHAVLDRPDSTSGDRENLKAFLDEVCGVTDFSMEQARVEREADHIDLLIKNDHQAVIIENKIWAGDQERQLQRYHDDLRGRGYKDAAIHIVYLTPDGREPEDQSRGEIPREKVSSISYRNEIQDWLIGCQRRAFNEPELRESITQYIHLIRRMTNTDYKGEHMNELKKLLTDGNNLVLAKQLSDARVHAQAALVQQFYSKVDKILREKMQDLPALDPEYAKLKEEESIRKCILGGRGTDSGLYYKIETSAWLSVAGDDRLWFGVACNKKDDSDLHRRLTEGLADTSPKRRPDDGTPWWRWIDDIPAWIHPTHGFHLRRGSNEPSLKFLAGIEGDQEKICQEIADILANLWGKIKERRLLERIEK